MGKHHHKKGMNRRKFIGTASCAAIGTTTFLNSMFNLGMINSLAAMSPAPKPKSNYKAMVCLLLAGGNDSFNMLVPRNGSFYSEYATTRSNLALAQNTLLPLNFTDTNGKQFGVHPSMPEVQNLFNNGKLAFVSNVGTLVDPLTKTQYLNGGVRVPLGLMSHSDQIQHWQTSIPQFRTNKGWGGRIADILQAGSGNPNLSMSISLSGTNTFQVGNTSSEYNIRSSAGGSVGITYAGGSPMLNQALLSGAENLLEYQYQDIYKQTYAQKIVDARDNHVLFQNAINGAPSLNTNFSASRLSQDMELIAKTIAVRNALSVTQQTFFVSFGGWDHHDEILDNQVEMLGIVSKAINELHSALVELGVDEDVTLFTISDFARTLTSNGNGTDHGWGGNTIVMGGSVNGGSIYGTYPSLAIGSNDDIGGAIILPTLSTDEYFAELALWFGVSPGDLPYVLPNITNFYNPLSGTPPVGFMS